MQPLTTVEVLLSELAGHTTEDGARQSSEVAFRRLLHAIVSLELPPSGMVSERELMELASCSRAALRPTVVRLRELGLLQAFPRKGFVVAPLGSLDASLIYEARWAIEARVARLAAERARTEDIELLEQLDGGHSEGDADPEDWQRFLRGDQELHLTVARIARNPYLLDALVRILPLASRIWHWVYGELDVREHVRFEHHDIVAAIRERDPDAAERAVTEHVQQAWSLLGDVVMPRLQGGAR